MAHSKIKDKLQFVEGKIFSFINGIKYYLRKSGGLSKLDRTTK